MQSFIRFCLFKFLYNWLRIIVFHLVIIVLSWLSCNLDECSANKIPAKWHLWLFLSEIFQTKGPLDTASFIRITLWKGWFWDAKVSTAKVIKSSNRPRPRRLINYKCYTLVSLWSLVFCLGKPSIHYISLRIGRSRRFSFKQNYQY